MIVITEMLVLLASGRRKPGMPLNILYTDTHRKNYLAPNVDSAETEKPWSRLT